MKPLQIAPENAGNRISEALKLKIFRGSMHPGPHYGLPPSAGVYPKPPSSNPGSAPEFTDGFFRGKANIDEYFRIPTSVEVRNFTKSESLSKVQGQERLIF